MILNNTEIILNWALSWWQWNSIRNTTTIFIQYISIKLVFQYRTSKKMHLLFHFLSLYHIYTELCFFSSSIISFLTLFGTGFFRVVCGLGEEAKKLTLPKMSYTYLAMMKLAISRNTDIDCISIHIF